MFIYFMVAFNTANLPTLIDRVGIINWFAHAGWSWQRSRDMMRLAITLSF